jgi:predicted dehydrogenase
MGVHMFDLMIGLFGLPRSVYARIETNVHDYGAEDSAVVLMKLANGAQVAATFHWCSKTWSHEFEVVGTEAKVKWHPFDADTFVKTVGRDIRDITLSEPENVHAPLVAEFSRWVIEGGEFPCTGEEARKTSVLMDAIYRSGSEGREITL